MVVSDDADKVMRNRECFILSCVEVHRLLMQKIHQCVDAITDPECLAKTLYKQHCHVWETCHLTQD